MADEPHKAALEALEAVISRARRLAAKWRAGGQGVDAGALVDLVYAVDALNQVQLTGGAFQAWNARYMGEPVICPACGADYAEAEAKNARLAAAVRRPPRE